ncbi:MAG: hypothetical protein COA78_34380 [Blastopirellula sp.]|nr:MAG: hypothetical protein COA78_34380 [Blastopirellula sp.]
MQTLDYIVLIGYFAMMILIGVISSFKIKKQEDYFMGGRSFGKLMQTFAAFGAGTGSNEPVQLGGTVWGSGLSGIWSVLMWLFVTPFYWIAGVWYRRMRHITLGDWFVERYQSQAMGVGYTIFALVFYMLYLSTMFSAISKVAIPLIGPEALAALNIAPENLKYYLVPSIAIIVVVYGVLGGIAAAYWTDLIQGLCIIALSVVLIPTGLHQLAAANGAGQETTMMQGFEALHERLPESYFAIIGGPQSGQFPLHYILSLTALAILGIVVQPHFIATGGGTAKTENAARVGLVTGNFLKRLCTIGWAITSLIVLALLANNVEIAGDPELAWGIATREILGPLNLGLVGLMLACLMAALMSSADTYMLVSSALVVRNCYAPYINSEASEKTYINVGRVSGLIVIIGAVIVSVIQYDVFGQFKAAINLPIIFASCFWIGMFWRRANKTAAWLTIAFSVIIFFAVPLTASFYPGLTKMEAFHTRNQEVTMVVHRKANSTDVAKRAASIELWESQENSKGDKPEPVALGDDYSESFVSGGDPIFWTGLTPVNKGQALTKTVVKRETTESYSGGETQQIVTTYTKVEGQEIGSGYFKIDYLLYYAIGYDLSEQSGPMLSTLQLPPRLFLPILVMILLSWITPSDDREKLDRYYAKMKTPVRPDPEEDQQQLELAYRSPEEMEKKKLFPGSTIEIQRPNQEDVIGFIVCFVICFGLVALAIWLASIGG